MHQVKVKRGELLEKVKANRQQHIREYRDACEGYKTQAIARIDEIAADLREKITNLKAGKMIDLVAVRFGLDAPRSFEKSYDQAIAMLEMSVDDEITLTDHEFAQYVLDDWEWQETFKTQTANYSSGRGGF